MTTAMTSTTCECKCGGAAPIAKKTNTKRGYVKGQPRRFINGHNLPSSPSVFPGQVYGRLTVLEELPERRNHKRVFACRCDCGRTVGVRGADLRSGKTLSCGCLVSERLVKTNTTHGHAAGGQQSPTYTAWAAMRQRCTNVKHVKFHLYGGRGIAVHESWLHSYEAFLERHWRAPRR